MRQQHLHGRFIFFSFGVAIALVFVMTTWVAADTTPTPAGVNTPVTFTGTGFAPNESLAIWITGADGASMTQGGAQSDGSGTFTTSVMFPTAGTWQATAHSTNTGKEFVGNYTVGAASGTTTAAVPGAPTVPSPSSGATASGTQAAIGTPVTFFGNGFTAHEAISAWETGPDGKVTALPGFHADNTGAFTDSVTFPSAGNWQVTAHGHDSAREVIGHYAVTDPSSMTSAASTASNVTATTTPVSIPTFTSPSTGVPVKATTGTLVTYTAMGFNAGETVTASVTPPDGSASTSLASVQASPTGRATVSTTFGTAGLWRITLHGRDSGHEMVGKYQVSAQA